LNDEDISIRATGEPVRFPSAEELRMVRAIALLALLEAARHGKYRATFHGFRVQAMREYSVHNSEAFVEINLCVSLGNIVVERALVATTDADTMEPKP